MKTRVICAAAISALLVACGGGNTNTTAAAEPAQPEAPPVEVTPEQLANAYEENTVAADDQYKGKKLRITGTIAEIATGITDEPYLIMKGGNQFMRTQLHFDKEHRASIAKLKKGQKIIALCNGAGDIAKTPMAKDCTLEQQ